jgi:hypothetical protein
MSRAITILPTSTVYDADADDDGATNNDRAASPPMLKCTDLGNELAQRRGRGKVSVSIVSPILSTRSTGDATEPAP